jgi:DnaJ-class molecular chaperone
VSAALATETLAAARRPHRRSEARLSEPSGSTLEDIVLGAWEDLALHGRTECPVCAGELEAAGCNTCGSELS